MQYVSISCFGNTGSSAVFDLLKEYDCVQVDREYEHLVLADREAVIDTYKALKTERGGASDVTIRRFMDEMHAIQYYRSGVHYFSDEQRKKLDSLTKTYVENVVSLEGISRNSILKARANINESSGTLKAKIKKACPWIAPLIRFRSNRRKNKAAQAWEQYRQDGIVGKDKGWYMRKTSNEELREHTANFIKGYLEMVTPPTDKPYFVLDHFLEVDHLNWGNEILGKDFVKTIVVLRDPRDQYISCISQGKDFTPFNIDVFCQHYRNCMQILKDQNEDYYHRVYFNDLIDNYEETVRGIECYLGIDGKQHHIVDVGKKLDISVSRKHNRRYLFEENKQRYGREIEQIERDLAEYLQN